MSPAQNSPSRSNGLNGKQALALASTALLLLGGGITALIVKEEKDKSAIKDELAGKSATDRIALACGNDIKIFTPKAVASNESASLTFQVGAKAENLLWLDSSHLAFTCPSQYPSETEYTTKDFDKSKVVVHASQLKILDLDKQKITTLIDTDNPSSTFTLNFGNIREKDLKIINDEVEARIAFDKVEGRKARFSSIQSSFVIEDIGTTRQGEKPNTSGNSLFFKVSGDWYSFDLNNEVVSKPVLSPPNIINSQLGHGGLVLVEPDGGIIDTLSKTEVKVQNPTLSNSSVIALDPESRAAAWWKE